MKGFLRRGIGAVFLAALLASMPLSSRADNNGTATTQTATHYDSSTVWVGQANGATSCNSVSQTAANDTITITPPAGQYFYLTDLIVHFSTDATGATAVPTISTTNIGAGGGISAVLSAATTLSTTGYHAEFTIPFPVGGLKSAAPGTAVTFVPSASMSAHTILCMSAVGYFNAN